VVRVHGFGNVGATDEEGLFMALEYLEGITLKERIKSQGRLSVPETVLWVTHICRAMTEAHGLGLIHRDLKPANVFLAAAEDQHVAKVLDFGVAKVPDALSLSHMDPTKTGAVLGTPYYMSPEQAQGLKDIDHRSDLWAIGVMTFECLTGNRPFTAKALGPLIMKVLTAPIPQPSTLVQVSPALDAWMKRALERDREARFSSAAAMAESLLQAAR
jgi:serine/threonine-protein kinase